MGRGPASEQRWRGLREGGGGGRGRPGWLGDERAGEVDKDGCYQMPNGTTTPEDRTFVVRDGGGGAISPWSLARSRARPPFAAAAEAAEADLVEHRAKTGALGR